MINTCLIASAGFGTRMGNLGKVIPKPLWPFFNLRMLDLQVEYVKKLGCKNIYINSHHCHEEMLEWLHGQDDDSITLLHEPEILGSGGCIHNLKNCVGDEIILVINSDQFYFFDFTHMDQDLQHMLASGAVAHLYAIEVAASATYNETIIKDGQLVDIAPHSGDESYYTYSGVGVIDLSKVSYQEGESSFFKSVCDYSNKKVLMALPKNPVFLDLGTLDKYINVISRLDKIPQVIREFLESTTELKIDGFERQSTCTWGEVEFDFEKKQITYKDKTYSF